MFRQPFLHRRLRCGDFQPNPHVQPVRFPFRDFLQPLAAILDSFDILPALVPCHPVIRGHFITRHRRRPVVLQMALELRSVVGQHLLSQKRLRLFVPALLSHDCSPQDREDGMLVEILATPVRIPFPAGRPRQSLF